MSDLHQPPLKTDAEITIRPAVESDWPELCHIYGEVRREQFPWVDPGSIREHDLYADAAGEAVHVLCHQGFPVGFVSVWEPDRFIHHLYLARDFQGRGLGGLLLDFAVSTQPGTFRLKCVEENHRAARFYQRKGWTVVEIGQSAEGVFLLMESPKKAVENGKWLD